jgi:hypothetical protein
MKGIKGDGEWVRMREGRNSEECDMRKKEGSNGW